MASTQHDQFKLLPGYDNVVTANGDYLVTTSGQPVLGSTLPELDVTNEEHYEVLERSSDGEYLRVRRRYNKANAIREGWAPINLFTHLVYIHQDEPLQLQAGYVNKAIATQDSLPGSIPAANLLAGQMEIDAAADEIFVVMELPAAQPDIAKVSRNATNTTGGSAQEEGWILRDRLRMLRQERLPYAEVGELKLQWADAQSLLNAGEWITDGVFEFLVQDLRRRLDIISRRATEGIEILLPAEVAALLAPNTDLSDESSLALRDRVATTTHFAVIVPSISALPDQEAATKDKPQGKTPDPMKGIDMEWVEEEMRTHKDLFSDQIEAWSKAGNVLYNMDAIRKFVDRG